MEINRSLKTLFILNSVYLFAESLFGPLYAIYVSEIDSKISSVSLSWAVYMISTVIFLFLMSKFGDRVKEKEYLLAGGYMVRALCWVLYIFVNDIYGLLIVQFILGIGLALGSPAWGYIFARHLDRGREIMDISGWTILANVIGAVGIILGGIVVTSYGFTPLFLIMSAIATVAFVGIIITPRRVL